ncbi:MAG: recombinase family protein [Clostridiaceae bacterium]|nr:recombinase family protein [Clostridiaceae bacterium]
MKTLPMTGTSALREIHYIEAAKKTVSAKPRVAGYARVSSDSDDQFNSFSAQVRYYTTLISSNEKWELADIYADEAVTGTSTEKRDDFNRMMADCRKGKINRIITKSVSRFARNTLDALKAIRDLKELGVTVYFEKENIDTAQLESEVLLTLYSAFAQDESLNIAQNKKRGNRMHMRIGDYVSPNVPYGYRLVDKLPHIYEPEAAVVRRIFSEYLSGLGAYEIARGLTEDGIPRKDGGSKWRPQGILVMLRNERYIGDMLLQKTCNSDDLPYKQVTNRGQLEKVYIKNTHEPIIDRLQFELANILLDRRGKLVVTTHGEYPLSKKLRCGDCGATYRRKVTNGITYWVCRRHNNNKNDCLAPQIPETLIYGAFTTLYNKLKTNRRYILTPMLNQLERMRERRYLDNPELRELNVKIAELSEQNHRMNELMAQKILDPALFISQSDALTRKLRELKLGRSRLMDADCEDELIENTEAVLDALSAGPEHLYGFSAELFAELVEDITVTAGKLTFRLKNGLRLTENIERR